MSFNKILNELQNTTPESFEQADNRRNILKSWGLKVAAIAVPLAGSALFNKANAQTKGVLIEKLNMLLKFEYIVHAYYQTGDAAANLVPPAMKPIIEKIMKDKEGHIDALKIVIVGLGGTPNNQPGIDFSGGSGNQSGPYYNAFNEIGNFLATVQMLDDSLIRAYKGQMIALKIDAQSVDTAMAIHSVTARHAAMIRTLRRGLGLPDVSPWVTASLNDTNNNASQKAYAGENVTSQRGIELTQINGYDISAFRASEAFDESLNELEAGSIFDPFVNP